MSQPASRFESFAIPVRNPLVAVVNGVAIYEIDVEDCEWLLAWSATVEETDADRLADRFGFYTNKIQPRSKAVGAAVLRYMGAGLLGLPPPSRPHGSGPGGVRRFGGPLPPDRVPELARLAHERDQLAGGAGAGASGGDHEPAPVLGDGRDGRRVGPVRLDRRVTGHVEP